MLGIKVDDSVADAALLNAKDTVNVSKRGMPFRLRDSLLYYGPLMATLASACYTTSLMISYG